MTAPKFIGGMRVRRTLGEGGFGSVYAVDVEGYPRPLALKVMSAKHQTNPSLILRFKREAEVIERLASEYVATVHTMGELEDGRPYILMELLDGKTLGAAIDEGPIHWRRAARLGLQICRALTSAHNMGVLHRDLKPDNIFIMNEGPNESIKILDFGIATFIPGHTDQYGSLTHTNALIGTPYYMSPEQVRAAAVGPTSDLYMLGVVMYEMLTGTRPFEGDNLGALLGAIVHGTCEPLAIAAPTAPRALCFVIERAMAVLAAERYKNAGAMAAALEAVWASAEPTSVTPQHHRAVQPTLSAANTEPDFAERRTVAAGDVDVPVGAHTLVGNPMDNERVASSPRPATASYEPERGKKTERGFGRGVFSAPSGPAVHPAPTGARSRPSLGLAMADRESLPTLPRRSRLPLFILAAIVLGLGAVLVFVLVSDDAQMTQPPTPIADTPSAPVDSEHASGSAQPPALEFGVAPPPLEVTPGPEVQGRPVPMTPMTPMTPTPMTRMRTRPPEPEVLPETDGPETDGPETEPPSMQPDVIEILDPFAS